MCEAHAFILQDGKEEKILDHVDEVYVQGDEVKMINIFGEQKMLKARFKSYNGTERKIVVEAVKCRKEGRGLDHGKAHSKSC